MFGVNRFLALWLLSVAQLALCAEQQSDEIGIGIDLGTTFSCVGFFKDGRVEIIANDQGNRITPSSVAFTAQGDRLIGDGARNQMVSNPENTVFDIKRLMGRRWNDPLVQADIKNFPFTVINKENKPYVELMVKGKRKLFPPEEISAMVLLKMKETAESFLGKKIKDAVVTVPAHFNDAQRKATKLAGLIAGLNVRRIINEPTAAAFAYGLDRKDGDQNILIYDLGGGTFDVTVLRIQGSSFTVLATNGDTHLGGEDFDSRVVDHFIKLYQRKKNKDIRENKRALQKLRREAEKAKRVLSYQQVARLEIDSLIDGKDFSEMITRAKFEELNMDLLQRTMKVVEVVLLDASLSKQDVNEVVLVGGSTRIPKVQNLIRVFFGKEASHGINPDEAVAIGAAVQAGVLSGDEDASDLTLIDINPLTLGIETVGGVMTKLIGRNTVIPTEKSNLFTTVKDNADTVSVRVYEGEFPTADDNHFLGQFDLVGIVPAPKGTPKIKVTFKIDVDGILLVSAEDTATGNTNSIVFSDDQYRLSEEDIQIMIQDAENYAEDDKKRNKALERRNQLEKHALWLVNQIEGQEHLSKDLSDEVKDAVVTLAEEEIQWIESNPVADAQLYETHHIDLKKNVQQLLGKEKFDDATNQYKQFLKDEL